MQEHPKSVNKSVQLFKEHIDESESLWTQLLDRSKSRKEQIESAKASSNRNSVVQLLPNFIGGMSASMERRKRESSFYDGRLEEELEFTEILHQLIEATEKTRREVDASSAAQDSKQTLVYWKDESGTHSFVTEQLQLS